MKESAIFARHLKEYDVSAVSGRTSDASGKQIVQRITEKATLAIYDKGTIAVKRQRVDSQRIAIIHIFSDPNTLQHDYEIPFDGRTYTVTEVKNREQHSFYKAVSNV